MKKPKIPKIPKLKFKKLRRKNKVTPMETPSSEVTPRITTETIAAHREDVIGSARKYIYPLHHSKHRIITTTIIILVTGVIAFFGYCTLALYRYQSTSTFIYRVTQIIPFPIAKAGGSYVSYESYLFEVRHYTHYYTSQLGLDFKTTEGQQQLTSFKSQALNKVINDAYVKKLADKYNVTVSDNQINDQITILRDQNRLGSSDKVFKDVLRDYWDWKENDFKRSLRYQILSQNVVASIDTGTTARADSALAELKGGANFSDVAKKYSDDVSSKDNGGDIGIVEHTKRDLTAQTVDNIYKLKPGQYSDVINIGYSLEIVKNLEATAGGKIHAAHVLFNFKDISTYLNDLKDQQKTKVLIKT